LREWRLKVVFEKGVELKVAFKKEMFESKFVNVSSDSCFIIFKSL
jgi:hypothetical protein